MGGGGIGAAVAVRVVVVDVGLDAESVRSVRRRIRSRSVGYVRGGGDGSGGSLPPCPPLRCGSIP